MTSDMNHLQFHEWLKALRQEAGYSVDEVCEKTKVHPKFVKALEDGEFQALPSRMHLKAFALTYVQVCGGDRDIAVEKIQQILSRVELPGRNPSAARESGRLRPGSDVPAAEESEGFFSRLPVMLYIVMALGVGLSFLLFFSVVRNRLPLRQTNSSVAVVSDAPAKQVAQAAETQEEQPVDEQMAAESENEDTTDSKEVSAGEDADTDTAELVFRARKDCWFVLEVDGIRQPVTVMDEGEKITWNIREKAVLLAGDIGALKIGWMGENLGYLGRLGEMANGLTFKKGTNGWGRDSRQELSLPPSLTES